MRIIFGINNFDNAGAENFMLRLANYFSSENHIIGIFSLQKIEDCHLNRINSIFGENIKKITILDPYSPSPFIDKILWKFNSILLKCGFENFRNKYIDFKTKKRIKNFKPDILNSHLFETDEYFSKIKGIPHVISMHGPYEYYLHKTKNDDGSIAELNSVNLNNRNTSFIKAANDIINSSKNVIYCADKNLEIFKYLDDFGISKEKIYYGFEKRKIHENSNERQYIENIGMFARGIKSKGWEVLIESFLIVSIEHPQIKLHLAYSESEYMNELVKKHSSNPKIKFYGLVDPIEEFLKNIDLVVFPTYYLGESLPNTIIESLMYNIPVITTNHAEIPKMICLDGKAAGKIINVESTGTLNLTDVSNIINGLIENNIQYLELKKNCSYVSTQFSMYNCFNRYLSFFEKIK